MRKIARNYAVLMQNKIISLTTTQALACMTPTLTPDPNSNPNSGHVSHTYVPLVHQAVQVGTGQRAVMSCGWGVKAGKVCVWVAGKTV